MSVTLNFHKLHMAVSSTVIDLSGRREFDVDGVVRELVRNGISTPDELTDLQDPDWFWAIVEDHEINA